MTKPILKWIGGKTQIIDTLLESFPKEMNNYYEPFLGGGSVLFGLLQNEKIIVNEKIYAFDTNEPLIYLYKNIQENHESFYNEIQKIITEFNIECNETSDNINRNPKNKKEAHESKEIFYYWIRKVYNKLSREDKKTVYGSALFLFLNKTCFRGIFRIGPNGMNVPYGHYKNPEIINKNHLDEIHNLIQNVVFESGDFLTSLKNVKKGDFIYMDPPYYPEKATSFVKYTKNGFSKENHEQLFQKIHDLSKEEIKIMLSNSSVEDVLNSFKNENIYSIKIIKCKRTINSKKPNSTTNEVIIVNYKATL